MIEIDFEDFVEEVKFEMTEYDVLDETIILDWEAKLRVWIMKHEDRKRCIIKNKNDIRMILKDEEETFEIAAKYYKAYKNDKLDEYWKNFKWGQ